MNLNQQWKSQGHAGTAIQAPSHLGRTGLHQTSAVHASVWIFTIRPAHFRAGVLVYFPALTVQPHKRSKPKNGISILQCMRFFFLWITIRAQTGALQGATYKIRHINCSQSIGQNGRSVVLFEEKTKTFSYLVFVILDFTLRCAASNYFTFNSGTALYALCNSNCLSS